MPVVTRSDCTQTNVVERYIFSKIGSTPGFSSVIDEINIQFQACQGANNKNNDLNAFVQQLVNDGKLSTDQQQTFNDHVVGNNNCPTVVDDMLGDAGFKPGFDIDETKWSFVVGEGFDDQHPMIDTRIVQERMEAQDVPIIRRVCPSCKHTHRDIYYRRLTPMPDGFNLLDVLMNNWFDDNNVLNEDFSLHSSYLDAYLGTDGWQKCNYNDPGIGFPRDCGPDNLVSFQWNSYTRGGGQANFHAFLIPSDPDFESKIDFPLFPKMLAPSYVLQSGTWIGGEVVKGFSTNDYLVYASINFGQSSTTKGFLINWAKGNEGGKLEIRLGVGTSGQLVGEISPARTKNWDTYETAYVDIIGDVSGVHDVTLVAKDNGGGVMNLAWFELTDFAEREEVHRRILGAEIANQSGATVNSDYGVGYFDDGDFVTYTHVNFGSAGTTDGIRIRTAKGNDGGTVEVRLGGPTGTLLAQFNPVRTGAWSLWSDLYVGVTDVTGIHDVTFVGKGVSGVMNMQWFELSSRKELYPHVPAMAFSTQSGLRSDSVHLTHFDSGDYVTYSKLNFGSSGATKSIRLSYAKANNSGSMEVRLGGPTGTIIGTFVPTNTGGWGTYVEAEVSLDLVDGIHDLTFVGRDSGGVLNLGWFELSAL